MKLLSSLRNLTVHGRTWFQLVSSYNGKFTCAYMYRQFMTPTWTNSSVISSKTILNLNSSWLTMLWIPNSAAESHMSLYCASASLNSYHSLHFKGRYTSKECKRFNSSNYALPSEIGYWFTSVSPKMSWNHPSHEHMIKMKGFWK